MGIVVFIYMLLMKPEGTLTEEASAAKQTGPLGRHPCSRERALGRSPCARVSDLSVTGRKVFDDDREVGEPAI